MLSSMTLPLKKRASCCVVCLILVCASGSVTAQEKSGIIYSQKAERDDMFFSKVFYPRNGRIYLTNDSLVFKAKDVYNDVFNFSIAICDIRYIRNYYGSILPNRIRIMTKQTGSVRILAYKKRKLKRLTRQQMAVCGGLKLG